MFREKRCKETDISSKYTAQKTMQPNKVPATAEEETLEGEEERALMMTMRAGTVRMQRSRTI